MQYSVNITFICTGKPRASRDSSVVGVSQGAGPGQMRSTSRVCLHLGSALCSVRPSVRQEEGANLRPQSVLG